MYWRDSYVSAFSPCALLRTSYTPSETRDSQVYEEGYPMDEFQCLMIL
jgi:hypothetical protein